MDESLRTVKIRGIEINIYQDSYDVESPRDWDNLGTIVCWHTRYNLGDEKPPYRPEEFPQILACEVDPSLEDKIYYWETERGTPQNNWNEDKIKKLIDKALQKTIILPIYMYEHSGITIRCSPFHDPWDSGMVGYIYITYDKIKKEMMRPGQKKNQYTKIKHVTKKDRERAKTYLIGEIETYDQYLTGEVYGFVNSDPDGWVDDESCWGFFGYPGNDKNWHVLQEAIRSAEDMANSRDEWITESLKKDVEDMIEFNISLATIREEEIGCPTQIHFKDYECPMPQE